MKRILYLFLIISVSLTVNAQKRAFTLDDIYRVKGLSGPALSPQGDKIAYSVTENTLATGKSKSFIYLMNSDGTNSVKLALGEKSVFNPFWSSDNNTLYFQRNTDNGSQVFAYSLTDKTEKQITNFYPGVNDPVFSPDGKSLAFSAEVYPECGADQECNKKNYTAADDGPVQAYMTDRLLYRHWTAWDESRYTHTFVFSITENKYKDITPGDYHTPIFSPGGSGPAAFSADGKYVYVVSNRERNQATTTNADIWRIPVTGGEAVNITAENKAYDGQPLVSPDGKTLAYRHQKIPGYESDLWRIAVINYDTKNPQSTTLTESFDNWIVDMAWAPDSKSIYFVAEVQGYQPLYKLDPATKKWTKVSQDRSIGSFVISPDGKYAYCVYRLMHKPAEIYRISLADGSETQLTNVNTALTEEVAFSKAEPMWVTGAAGKKVHIWLVKPFGFDPSKKYPLIVNVHGGPQSQWMDAYRPDAQVYGGYGYVVAFPNPHGSTGYGQAYTAAISGDWGGKVYEDVMKVTDALEKLPYIDKNRIGAMGWSYGGYMMNWLQGHTKRFKCLVSMMGLYNLTSFYGTTEELWFPEWDVKGQPWNSKLYEKFSPHNYVKNFATPTLILTGERDYRVSYTQSLEYFTALQKLGIDSKLIVFKNDGHWPSHLKSMPLYYNAHLEWFNRYLGGDPAPYDSEMLRRNRAFEKK